MDSILMIDQDLVTEAIQAMSLNTLSAYRNGASVKWNEAELAIYLVYIFGEINKSMYLIPIQKVAIDLTYYSRRREGSGSILSSATCR